MTTSKKAHKQCFKSLRSKKVKPLKKKKLINVKDDHVPMSKNQLFDNSAAWLDDEPWRTW